MHLACLIAAFVVFVIAAFVSTSRVNLTACGLALLTLSFIVIR